MTEAFAIKKEKNLLSTTGKKHGFDIGANFDEETAMKVSRLIHRLRDVLSERLTISEALRVMICYFFEQPDDFLTKLAEDKEFITKYESIIWVKRKNCHDK